MLGQHDHAALQFSGGKDSLALLHLARPWLDRITVFFSDTGGVYPHVVEFVHRACADLGAKLVVVKTDVFEYTAKWGLPSDIVPVDVSPEMATRAVLPEKPKQMIQSSLTCCANLIWLPMLNAIQQSGIKLVLRGSKRCDSHQTVPTGFIENGIQYDSPLWDWSDDQVMDFLRDKPMPEQYPEIRDSMDCWACTAHMTSKYAKEKLEFAKRRYPDLWPVMRDRISRVQRTVAEETAKVNAALEVADS